MGDFNVRFNDLYDKTAQELLADLDSLGLIQQISGATHDKGNQLDAIFSFEGTVAKVVTSQHIWTDHSYISFLSPTPFPLKNM